MSKFSSVIDELHSMKQQAYLDGDEEFAQECFEAIAILEEANS